MKTYNVRYITVHSTKSIPGNLPEQTGFHYLITSDGRIIQPKQLSPKAGTIAVAYVGGMNQSGKPGNTMNEMQEEKLFNLLVKLSSKFRRVSIRGANEFYGDWKDTGFDLVNWMKSFIPKVIRQYHPAAAA
jgi:hypothetical protein